MQANRGFALVATMMVLALISVLGAMAIQSATLEVQISAHDRDARAALYVAEAALDEARYYVSRGWGKIEAPAVSAPVPGLITVDVVTGVPPAVPWGSNLYVDFTLVDAAGRAFRINANSATSPPTITLDTSAVSSPDEAPTSGRFVVVRQISAWSWADPQLAVPDNLDVWSINSSLNTWRGWILFDDGGQGLTVTDSDINLTPAVELTLDGDIAAFNFAAPMLRLGINPWLAAQVDGSTALGGDADTTSTDVWDRVFVDGGGAELGRAGVEAQPVAGEPGSYTLTSRGGVGTRRHTVRLTVFRAGAPTQATGDWVIDDG